MLPFVTNVTVFLQWSSNTESETALVTFTIEIMDTNRGWTVIYALFVFCKWISIKTLPGNCKRDY